MTILYFDPIFLEHNTGNHPENAGRINPVMRQLHFVGLDGECKQHVWQAASHERLQYVHKAEYVDSIKQFAAGGGGRIEADTVLSAKSYEAARMASGAVCDAVERVVKGEDKTAFCILRPPGHHALADNAMGFCLFNNIAVGARVARRELGVERVLIVDWDVHHGNGTQDMFYTDPTVGFLSMHRFPFYPGSGAANEIGEGEGRGATLNLPIEFGTSREKQLALFQKSLNEFADQIKPELIMISAGFDSHKADPIGSLGLESNDFEKLTQYVREVANKHAQGRIVSVLEGGYNPAALTECVEIHLRKLLATDPK